MRDEQALAALSWMERIAFRVMRFLNQGWGRRPARIWQLGVITPLVGWLLVYRRLRVYGIERLDGIPRDAPILLVTNHRTFFDLFILGWLLIRHPRLSRRVNFPVRSNFFYETPLGLLMSALLTGGSMFPPFFRSAEKKAMNRYSLQQDGRSVHVAPGAAGGRRACPESAAGGGTRVHPGNDESLLDGGESEPAPHAAGHRGIRQARRAAGDPGRDSALPPQEGRGSAQREDRRPRRRRARAQERSFSTGFSCASREVTSRGRSRFAMVASSSCDSNGLPM